MISIIVPIYNAERYLSGCINSLINQTYTDFEVLLVDDGSTDNSKNICQKYVLRDKRFKLISKDNGGVSSARNIGIHNSTSEYIYFMDSDDFLEKDAILKMVSEIKDYDLIIFGYNIINEKNKIVETRGCPSCIINNKGNSFDKMVEIRSKLLINPPWNKLYKKELMTELFDEQFCMGEDLIFNLNYINNCRRIKIIEDKLYNYRLQAQSATSRFRIDSVENLVKLYNIECTFVSVDSGSDSITKLCRIYIDDIFWNYIGIHGNCIGRRKILEIFKKWDSVIEKSDLLNHDKDHRLFFIKRNNVFQYYYTLFKYGVVRKYLKKMIGFYHRIL